MNKFILNTVLDDLINVNHIVRIAKDLYASSGYMAELTTGKVVPVNEDFYNQCKNIHSKAVLVEQKTTYPNTGPR